MSPSHNGMTSAGCVATREVLNRVGDKWSVYVVGLLGSGPKRFSELRRTIEGISQRMLTLTLRGLERDGLVTRTVFPSIPPRVDYSLTPLGRTLLEPVTALADWAQKNGEAIHAARAAFDARAAEPPHAAGRSSTSTA
jgi:DNA-binding HxlR family transcriptional regulator